MIPNLRPMLVHPKSGNLYKNLRRGVNSEVEVRKVEKLE